MIGPQRWALYDCPVHGAHGLTSASLPAPQAPCCHRQAIVQLITIEGWVRVLTAVLAEAREELAAAASRRP